MRALSVVVFVLFTVLGSAQNPQMESNEDKEESSEDAAETLPFPEDEVEHTSVEPDQLEATEQYRREKLPHRVFDEEARRKIIGDTNFDEDTPKPEAAPRVQNLAWAGDLLKAIAYTVVAGIIMVILYLVIENLRKSATSRRAIKKDIATPDVIEDIQELDVGGLLNKALAEKNYKVAVRLYYLLLLKNLQNAGMIKWEKDKTNRDYLYELYSVKEYFEDVRTLTRKYEEVWYGDRPFTDDSLLPVIASFEVINNKLNPVKAL